MSTLFDECDYAKDDNYLLLLCISNQLEEYKQERDVVQESNLEWVLTLCGFLVFLMQAGFAMLCAGSVRKKNLQNTMLKNLLDTCGAAAAFYTIGYAFAFGGQDSTKGKTFIGTEEFFFADSDRFAFWFFQVCFVASCNTIVAGTIAERCQMPAYFYYSIFLAGFAYPVVAHTIWSDNGYLSAFAANPYDGVGVFDFAGGGAVHLMGGWTSLIASSVLGARTGRFYDEAGSVLKTPKVFPGHSIALQLLGTFLLWFGWYGFNTGSALLLADHVVNTGKIAARVAANTTLSGAAGGLSALFTNMLMRKLETNDTSFDLGKTMNGTLGGLVAITSCCGTIEPWAAIVVGVVAGWLYIFGSHLLVRFRIDDVVDGIPVHLTNGAWSLIAAGLFSAPGPTKAAYGTDEHVGLFYMVRGSFSGTLLKNQFLAILAIIFWGTITMLPFFYTLNHYGLFRADNLEEVVGLDIRYHGSTAEENDEVQQDLEAYQETLKKNQKRLAKLAAKEAKREEEEEEEKEVLNKKNAEKV